MRAKLIVDLSLVNPRSSVAFHDSSMYVVVVFVEFYLISLAMLADVELRVKNAFDSPYCFDDY